MSISHTNLGIAAIATYEPSWRLANDWFEGIPRKFVAQTGIQSRPISQVDEVTMGIRAAMQLQREVGCDWRKCAGAIFVSPSFIPIDVAKKYLPAGAVRHEQVKLAARQFARQLRIPQCRVHGINWFCSGYAKALSIASQIAPTLNMGQHDFLLVVTSGRISRITDYGCRATAPLFGDLATATLLTRLDSPLHPPHLQLLYADAHKQKADGAFFNFHLRENVLAPTQDGGRVHQPQRVVFSLDGIGIADAAPRAMSNALAAAMEQTGNSPSDLRYVVPHQAGTGIVKLASMKMESLGIQAEVINGMTADVGNVSSSSIPYALKRTWQRLDGLIACPTAAVGMPGQKEISQGCILLRATPFHRQIAAAA